jgi:hypothetical protein
MPVLVVHFFVSSRHSISHIACVGGNTAQANDETPWPRVMQALSHFSYHQSGGQHVLCDLQGGVYRDGIVLTDPAVLSRTKE